VCRAPPFTLLELAVVLGIIVLLAALLLPALGQARDRARLGQCAAQVRQIGIALHAYAVDSRDRLPDCARLGPEPGSGLPSLAAVLAPYSEAQARLFACPADLGAGAAALFARTGTSYEWNTFVNGRRIDRSSWRIAGLEVVTPLAGDADAFHGGGLRNYLYADGRVTAAFEVLLQP
jgi:prepilin-type processing-associated H-X9-DG protein